MLTRDQTEGLSADELEAQIRHHNQLYWVEHRAELPDEIYDALVERLRTLRPDAEVLTAIGPAGAIGDVGWGDKVEHDSPMLSLDKAYDEETVQRWYDRFEGGAVASPKIDGLACSLRYDGEGRLALATTRGDGLRGDVITENVRRIGDAPAQIDAKDVEVRGEVYMPLSVFADFKDDYANPRNLAAGALKHKTPEKTAPYRLRFFAYDLIGESHETERAKAARLKALGFSPVEQRLVEREALQSSYDEFLKGRGELDYETDGVVYRVDLTSEQVKMGHTSHHPRYAIAYKYQGEAGTSTLEDVFWSVSRSGIISPVAIVAPVSLSGATVTRAGLHNLSILESLGLTRGATVMMMRRGGVIPHIEGVVEAGEGAIEVPTQCPACSGATERRGDFLYCVNPDGCRQTRVGLLKYFITVIDCKGFGEKIIEQLYDQGLVREPADFYALRPEALLPLERMGETLATKLVANVNASRSMPLATFLRSMGVHSLGRTASREISRRFRTIEAARAATAEEIAAIHGLGELTGASIVEGLAERAEAIDRLLKEVSPQPNIDARETKESAGVLKNKGFLFTGALASMKRKDAQARVIALGGETPRGVSKTLRYLVLGDADHAKFEGGWRSGKLKKAEKLNGGGAAIEVISETRFVEILSAAEAEDAAESGDAA